MHAKKQHWKQWAETRGVDELKEDWWQAPVKTFLKKSCTVIWTNEHKTMARHLVADGNMTQVKLLKLGWARNDKSQKCEADSEKHRLYFGREWGQTRDGLE